jgi:hypothetical protein
MTKRHLLIFTAIASPLFAAWCIYDLVRQHDTRDIVVEFSTAVKAMEQTPPGTERAEQFVRRIKAINTGHAPAEVKQALADYITAMERGLTAAQARQDTTALDQTIAERKQALIDAVNKYQ